jgi:hypothetical protein
MLMFPITTIFGLFIFNKTKKIFDYLANDERKSLLKLKKNSKPHYILLTLSYYIFKNIIFSILLIVSIIYFFFTGLKHTLDILSGNPTLICVSLFFLLITPPLLLSLINILFKNYILIPKIIQKTKTNPLLIDYIVIKITQKKSIQDFYEINENLELIINSKELLNYIQSKIPTERSIEEIDKLEIDKIIEEIDKFIELIKRCPAFSEYITSELSKGKDLNEIKNEIDKKLLSIYKDIQEYYHC